jgi:hypothetical protein
MADTTSVLVTDIDISLNTKTVNPRDTLWQLVLWSTLNIAGALLMLFVLVLSMCIPHLRKLPLLLNYELILIFTCASASILTWTGHMYDQNPPIGLCIFNASTNVATTTACGLATLCLTISVSHRDKRWLFSGSWRHFRSGHKLDCLIVQVIEC